MKPTIKIKGWWWKKFFPKYRKLNKHMNGLIAYVYEKERKKIGEQMEHGLLNGDYLETPKRWNYGDKLDN